MDEFKNSEEKIWEETPKHGILPNGAEQRMWKNIIKATGYKKQLPYTYKALAAVLVIALMAVGTFYLSHHFNPPKILMVKTDPNDIRLLKLPDGSRIWVNENTEVTYPEKFVGNERKVHLTGEAFFDIARDTTRPFKIESDGFTTTVLGTRFNINAYQNQIHKVSVVSGRVRVTTTEMGKEPALESMELTKGEATIYKRKTFERTTLQTREIDWKKALVDIDNKSLDEITRLLSQIYHITFVPHDGDQGDIILKGTLDIRQPLSYSLDVLSFALEDVDFHQKNDTIWVIDRRTKTKSLTHKNDTIMSE